MKKKIIYKINENEFSFILRDSTNFISGNNEILSNEKTDITFNQYWYNDGFKEIEFLNQKEFDQLKQGLTESLSSIISKETSFDSKEFSLENYHKFIKNNADHLKIVSKTRDLFPNDFGFPIKDLIPRFEKILGFPLTDVDPFTKNHLHIIIRINRPNSNDFNPPHKDIYESIDNNGYIPQFINFWIPIAGVNGKSNLPLVPKSHLLNENQILRTFEGGEIEGNNYRVRMIKSWNERNNLIRSKVKYGQVLLFSSHLIHGLALNENLDLTRVALEFRLFKSI